MCEIVFGDCFLLGRIGRRGRDRRWGRRDGYCSEFLSFVLCFVFGFFSKERGLRVNGEVLWKKIGLEFFRFRCRCSFGYFLVG